MTSDLKRRLGSYPTVDVEPYYEVLQRDGSVKVERYQVAKKHPSRIIRQVDRENPLPAWGWYAALIAGAAAIVGVTYVVTKSTATPATSPSPPNFPPSPAPPLQQVSGGGVLTVSPTLQTQTVSLDVQDPVLIYLPTGATWSSMDGAPVADKTSPIAFTFLGPINHTIVWFDSLNQQHESTYFFVLNPSPTPTTNA